MLTTEVPMLDLLAASGGQGPCRKLSLKCSKGSNSKGQGSVIWTLLRLKINKHLVIVQLCQTPVTHSGTVSATPFSRRAGGQKAERAVTELHQKLVLVTGCPHLTCSNTGNSISLSASKCICF